MYIPDLMNVSIDDRFVILAVGWLDGKVPNSVSEHLCSDLMTRVKILVDFTLEKDFAVKRMRGIHWCNLCKEKDDGSNACILLPTEQPNRYFLTNFLLPHYVAKHRYAPPEEFVRAISADFSTWRGPSKEVETSIVVSSPEGEAIERMRLQELVEKNPHLRRHVFGDD